MRESLVQAKKIEYTFTTLSYSHIMGKMNSIDVPGIRIKLPLDQKIVPGERVYVIGTIDRGVQSIYSERISLASQSIYIVKPKRSYVLSSFYELVFLLEGFPQEIFIHLSRYLKSSQGPLLQGIIFGGTQMLPAEVLQDTKITGLVHVLSASGYNVAIVVGFSLSLFTRLFSRRIAAGGTVGVAVLYACMTGLSAPILRSVIMSILYLLGVYLGRQYSGRWACMVSAVLMLINQPFLLFSPSFLLTFTATAGVLFRDVLWPSSSYQVNDQHSMQKIWGILEENMKTTVSVLIFTTPITLLFFGTFSLVSILSNTFLLWIISPIMFFGLVLCVLVWFPGLLLEIAVVPTAFLLEVFSQGMHVFARMPIGLLQVQGVGIPGVLLWYFALLVYIGTKVADKDGE